MQFRRNLGKRTPTSGKRLPESASSRYSRPAALFLLLLSATSACAATLQYDAYLSGLPIGTATVEIDLSESGYRISGTAASQGVAHLFSDWRSDFLATGLLNQNTHTLTAYAYDERDRKKQRVLWLADGKVRHVKNGQVRPAHPIRTGTDILTAFFLQADCWTDRQLHTGRYSYLLTGRPSSEAGGCHFEVTGKSGDRSHFHVRFGEHHGMWIPVEARTRGLLRGRVKLRTPAATAGGGEAADVLLAERP